MYTFNTVPGNPTKHGSHEHILPKKFSGTSVQRMKADNEMKVALCLKPKKIRN